MVKAERPKPYILPWRLTANAFLNICKQASASEGPSAWLINKMSAPVSQKTFDIWVYISLKDTKCKATDQAMFLFQTYEDLYLREINVLFKLSYSNIHIYS